ncbi:hypothetical protein ACWD48_12135 [Streptomyces sp. NPDC002519]
MKLMARLAQRHARKTAQRYRREGRKLMPYGEWEELLTSQHRPPLVHSNLWDEQNDGSEVATFRDGDSFVSMVWSAGWVKEVRLRKHTAKGETLEERARDWHYWVLVTERTTESLMF